MKYSAGFIGVGNMGSALASAVYQQDQNIALCDKHPEKLLRAREKLPKAELFAPTGMEHVARNSQFLFLGIKPNVILQTAEAIKAWLSPETVVVTMAAGVKLEELVSAAGTDRCIRIMPNTPASVGQGVILYCCGTGIGEAEEQEFLHLMSSAGLVTPLSEDKFDAGMALSGCGPAFVYIFAQALADGAVACGLPRAAAAAYAAQTILGSAVMLQQSGKHPEQLKDEVCSPGGTTIAGVLKMEESGFRAAAAQAVVAAYQKASGLK